MTRVESRIGGSSLADDLLSEVFGALLAPMVIIRRDRRVIFRSKAFEELFGGDVGLERLKCDVLILPRSQGCCVDAIDHYPDNIQSGIWNIRSARDGKLVPVLATWRPVNVGLSMSFLAIQFQPLPDKPSPVAHSFFAGLRLGSPGAARYWERVHAYLEHSFGVRRMALLAARNGECDVEFAKGLGETALSRVREVMAETAERNQDILIGPPDTREVLHAVSLADGAGSHALVLGQLSDDFGLTLFDTALAALEAAQVTRDTPGDFAPGVDAQALVETLSPAETEVLEGILAGLTDKEIAKRRGVSPFTVKNQVKAILRKTGAARRTELMRRMKASPPR